MIDRPQVQACEPTGRRIRDREDAQSRWADDAECDTASRTGCFELTADGDAFLRRGDDAAQQREFIESADRDREATFEAANPSVAWKRGDAMVGNETRIREVTQEEASAAENVHPKRVPEWTASVRGALSSSPNMTIKTVENRLNRSVEGYADSARPVGQMLSRSEMSASGELRVPVLTQLVGEARNEWPGRSDSKIANSPGRLEELGKHDVLLSWGRHDNAEQSEVGASPYARSNAQNRFQLRITIGSALNRPVDDWGKLLGDTAAVTALLDRLLHHAHVLKCGPRSWRTKLHTDLRTDEGTK